MTEKANFEPPNEGNAIPPHPNSILLVDMYLKKNRYYKAIKTREEETGAGE